MSDEIEHLRRDLRFAAGLISTMDQFSDKHPQEVLEWVSQKAAGGGDE